MRFFTVKPTERGDMEMLQAYQGYFDKGRFVSPEAAAIPDKARVIVTLLNDEVFTSVKTRAQQQLDAIKSFISDNSGEDELSADDYAELQNGKYRWTPIGRYKLRLVSPCWRLVFKMSKLVHRY